MFLWRGLEGAEPAVGAVPESPPPQLRQGLLFPLLSPLPLPNAWRACPPSLSWRAQKIRTQLKKHPGPLCILFRKDSTSVDTQGLLRAHKLHFGSTISSAQTGPLSGTHSSSAKTQLAHRFSTADVPQLCLAPPAQTGKGSWKLEFATTPLPTTTLPPPPPSPH